MSNNHTLNLINSNNAIPIETIHIYFSHGYSSVDSEQNLFSILEFELLNPID